MLVIFAQLKKHRNLLLRFTHGDVKAQKYLLGGIEQVIALHKNMLLTKVPAILKVNYFCKMIYQYSFEEVRLFTMNFDSNFLLVVLRY